MKKILIILAAAFQLTACNQSSSNPDADSASGIKNVITTGVNPVTKLDFVEKWEGKTAREAGMFQDSTLVQRLQELLGNEYQYFQENWNVQTPIVKEKNIYSASGCKQHDCSSYNSIVYFDVKNNNINVFIKRGPYFKLFTEKGPIDLPEQFKKEQGVIRQNA